MTRAHQPRRLCVAFRPEYGSQIGLGHLARDANIAQALSEAGALPLLLADHMPAKDVEPWLGAFARVVRAPSRDDVRARKSSRSAMSFVSAYSEVMRFTSMGESSVCGLEPSASPQIHSLEANTNCGTPRVAAARKTFSAVASLQRCK